MSSVAAVAAARAVALNRESVFEAGEDDGVHKPHSAPPFGPLMLETFVESRTDDGLGKYNVDSALMPRCSRTVS